MNPIARRALLLAAAAATTLAFSGCVGRPLPSEFDQLAPAVNGENVVWEDSRSAETQGTDIWAFNTGTVTESLVAGGAGEQDQPAISDRYIVWIDDGRLRAKDLSSGAVFSVTNGPATQADPAVCGSVVVWSDTANSDVYAKNLAGGSQIAVATSPAVEAYPACDAGRVVYTYAPAGAWSSIKLYDIGSGQTRSVRSEPVSWNEWRPAISGNRVVWQAWPNQPDTVNGIQILGTDLATGQDFVVSNRGNHQTAPAISGSTVAWEDVSSGQREIWWRDLATTMQEMPVAGTEPGSQQGVSLFGRRVVFQGDGAGPWNVYIGNLFFYTGTG